MSFEPHYINTYIIYGICIWLFIVFVNFMYDMCISLFIDSSDSSEEHTFPSYPYITNSKHRLIKSITNKHFSQKNPNKYEISSKLRTRCKKLRVYLYWSQWKSNKINGIKKLRRVWKPPGLLKMECERRENILQK